LTDQLTNNPPEFSEYFNQTVTWQACDPLPDWTAYEVIPPELECAEVQAPLDWSDPATTPIRLAVFRIRTADVERRLGSVFLNYGGPGASGIEGLGGSYEDFAVDERYRNLSDYYDLVSWDPRGVGRSSRIVCEVFTAEVGGDVSEQRALFAAAYRAHAESCLARSEDGVAEFADTLSSARDLNLLRALLGEDKLNYIGMSWGSMLGGAMAALFPDRLNRVVLDGVESPNLSVRDNNALTVQAADLNFRYFLKQCQELELPEGVECIFTGASDQAMQQLGEFLAAADQEPIPVAGQTGVSFSGDKIFRTMFNALYYGLDMARIRLVEAFYRAETQQDATFFLDFADFTLLDDDLGTDDVETEDNEASVLQVTNCADGRISEADELKQNQELVAQYPLVGKYLTDASFPESSALINHAYLCEGLPDHSNRVLDLSNSLIPPILLSAGTGDPATPYAAGELYAKELANSVFLTFDGPGHCPFGAGASDCTIKAVTDFLISGIMPANGTVCTSG
jgi:pimeloyl-ACP methyl ester carboxylesterase